MTLECLSSKCDVGMSVENVPAVVKNVNTEKTIYCTQVLYWVGGVGVLKSVEKKRSVADQFAVKYCKSETYFWTQKLNKEDYGLTSTGYFLLL